MILTPEQRSENRLRELQARRVKQRMVEHLDANTSWDTYYAVEMFDMDTQVGIIAERSERKYIRRILVSDLVTGVVCFGNVVEEVRDALCT